MKKKIIIISTLIVLIISLGGIYLNFSTPSVYINHPNYIELKNNDDEVDYSFNHQYQGGYVELKDVSTCFINTLINTEDKNFYSHHGLDYKRILKSLLDNLLSFSITQGASTITQQLARNLYLTNEKTWTRKIKEAVIAKKIENRYSKDYILELYINSVYFAHNIYGLKTASQYYFNKEPSELNYQESCLLVGVINGPNVYSPFIDEEASKAKQKSIAFSLYQNSIITAQEYYDILQHQSQLYGKLKSTNNIENYYYQATIRELKKRKAYIEDDTSMGIQVTTYYQKDIEQIIQKAINNYQFDNQIAVVVMKPYSNEVLALCGGKNYQESEYNRALDSYRQIGSTVKPFIYYLGLKSGMTPLSKFMSKPTTFELENGTVYTPKNANNVYANRDITMVEALGMSDNIYAVKTTLLVGSESVNELLNLLGAENKTSTLAISLGGIELTPLQLAAAYNTFASEGNYYPPRFVKEVSNFNGNVIYKAKKTYKTVLSHDECIMINYLLRSPFDRGLITYSSPTMASYPVRNSFACKTGTTESSSWTVGFNKDYTILVYVGDDNNEALSDGTVSKKIWRDIATTLTLNKKDEFYSIPSSLKTFKFHNGIYSSYSYDYLRRK